MRAGSWIWQVKICPTNTIHPAKRAKSEPPESGAPAQAAAQAANSRERYFHFPQTQSFPHTKLHDKSSLPTIQPLYSPYPITLRTRSHNNCKFSSAYFLRHLLLPPCFLALPRLCWPGYWRPALPPSVLRFWSQLSAIRLAPALTGLSADFFRIIETTAVFP